MMTLKFSQNTKMTSALTGRRPVRPVVDDGFEIECPLKGHTYLHYKSIDWFL